MRGLVVAVLMRPYLLQLKKDIAENNGCDSRSEEKSDDETCTVH